MAWTAPRTWVSGELVTAALMNSAVRDNLLAIDTFIGGRDLTASRILIGAGTSAITDTGDATLNGDLTVSGTGPHVFGGAVDSQSTLEKFEAEFGKGIYETTFLDGTTGPAGYGKWRTIAAMEAGLPTEIHRSSIWRDVAHAREMLNNLPKTNKIYQGGERGPLNRPGVKANVFADIGS